MADPFPSSSAVEPRRHDENIVVTRRRFALALAASFGVGGLVAAGAFYARRRFLPDPFVRYQDVLTQMVPTGGIKTHVAFGDALQKVIAAGALDPGKLRANYGANGGAPAWLEGLLAKPSSEPIVFNLDTAPHLLNLLWPIGLSTKTKFNETSPVNTSNLPNLASTAGWTLGHEENGAAYFNKVGAIQLSHEQEARVKQVASTTFRPCCDNPTLLQDCNHGSALLGLLELGGSQGLDMDDLYRLALIANSHWFPAQYAKTALHLALFDGVMWRDTEPRLILGPEFSTLTGWQRNVNSTIKLAEFMPRNIQMSQRGCAI